MTAKRRTITIDELNDKVAGRLAREAELERIRAAGHAALPTGTGGRRFPGTAAPANHVRSRSRKSILR